MTRRNHRSIRSLVALTVAWYCNAPAQWSGDPTVNNPISTASGAQVAPVIISDGSGGAIIAWDDLRNGTDDIYAQRIDASGVVQWTSNGVAISLAAGTQNSQVMVSDGAGGAIIAWQDMRGATNDIYAQRVDASGTVRWTTDGIAISTATGEQYAPVITGDGSGGAIIAWYDTRSSTSDDVYAQRIDSAGTVRWTSNGVAVSTATDNQLSPAILADSAGSAIIVWQDRRNGNYDIFAQRIDSSGTAKWTANGVAVCLATGNQIAPVLTSDGAGGAIITWQDLRSTVYDIYAQRVNGSGVVQWATNGVVVSAAWNHQQSPVIASDGAGGAIIAWRDWRSDGTIETFTTYEDLYAQRVNGSGVAQWTTDGVALSTAADAQANQSIVADGSGGAIVAWQDHRNGTDQDVFAQRIDASGSVQWTSDGAPISTAAGNQTNPVIIGDGSGGALVTWFDARSGSDLDIYSSRIFSNSTLPVQLTSFTATAGVSIAELRWKTATELNNFGFDVERRALDNSATAMDWRKIAFVEGHGSSSAPREYRYTDNNLAEGHYAYRVRQMGNNGSSEYTGEVDVQIDLAPVSFALGQNYPNPFNPTTNISFQLPAVSSVVLKVYDFLGREVATLANGEWEAGFHQVTFDASNLASGVYFYRMRARQSDGGHAGSFTASKRLVIMK